MEFLNSADFWIGLVKIVWINIILSGDNAVVIALAARSLPPAQQKKAIMFGSGAAVVLRIVLTIVAAKLLELSFLQIVGGCLLLWIGLQLLTGEEDDEGESKGHGSMMVAIRTILIADLVMSLDNVIAVAATAQGNMVLLILGLAISIPLVIFGSTLMIKLMERFPVIITLGAALIGWVGGETIVNDNLLHGYTLAHPCALRCLRVRWWWPLVSGCKPVRHASWRRQDTLGQQHKGAVGALFYGVSPARAFRLPTAAPAKLHSPQPQREHCSLKQEQLALDRVRLRQTLRQSRQPAQSYTLCSKTSRRAADDKNVTF